MAPRSGSVDLNGEHYKIGAKITIMCGYLAHADQKGLLGFVTGTRGWSSQVRIVHGETSTKHELGERLKALCREGPRNLELLISSGTSDIYLPLEGGL